MNRNRGLSALIPTGGSTPPTGQGFAQIAVELIDPNPHQPRTRFDEESLDELAASIGALGVLQPVLVRKSADGRYQLIAGERRLRAAPTTSTAPNKPWWKIFTEQISAHSRKRRRTSNCSRTSPSRMTKWRRGSARVVRQSRMPCAFSPFPLPCSSWSLTGGSPPDTQRRCSVWRPAKSRTATSSSRSSTPGSATVVPTAAYAEVAALLGEQLATRVQVHPPRGTTRRGQLVIDFADIDDLERLSRVILD
jgi:hypothetical protein